jgi:acetyl-CoA carboxylase/biotin carboxylase 1
MGGLQSHQWLTIAGFLRRFVEMEALFSGKSDDVVLALRDANRNDLDKVVAIALSHSKVGGKNRLILSLLDIIKARVPPAEFETFFGGVLHDIANLDNKLTSKVALKAREVLIGCTLPSLSERHGQMEQILRNSVYNPNPNDYGVARRKAAEHISLETIQVLIDSGCALTSCWHKAFRG